MPFITERLAPRALGGSNIVRILVGFVLLAGLALGASSSVAAPTVSVTPATAVPGEALTVSWSGIANPRRHDWLGLYTPGAPDVALRSYAFTTGGADGTLAFPLPSNLSAGNYELRLFSSGAYRRIAVSHAFKVQNPPPRPLSPMATLTVAPASIGAGQAVTVTWTDVVAAAANDWIGLFKPGASDKAFRSYAYTTGTTSGSVAFPIPARLADGSYELRLFANGKFTRIAVSNRLAVTDRPTQPPPTTPGVTLAASPASVAAGGAVTASWTGISAPAAGDWIGLFRNGASDSAHVARSETGGAAAGNVSINIPLNATVGSYELRLFAASGSARLAGSNAVSVTAAPEARIYFIHTDHLNTPRVITNSAGQAVWRWDNMDPFGVNAPDENPSGLGTFTCNLRFPGQYFDRETNLHYNYFRDYDPTLGRYVQSDPIGLDGGLNTYSYASGNPLAIVDPMGLKGCGAGVFEPFIPNNPRGFPFEACCDEHDDCYADCEKQPTKFQCDFRFWTCMLGKCTKYRADVRMNCEKMAGRYAGAVANLKRAQQSFEQSRARCVNCPKP